MVKIIKKIIKKYIHAYQKRVCKVEFEGQSIRFNERPVEFSFVFDVLKEIYPCKILDVGTGTTALPHLMRNCGFHVTAIDNVHDYWTSDFINRHYHIIDDNIVKTNLNEKFDVITCISVLEHILEPDKAIKNMAKLLNVNGFLIITFPYSRHNYIRNVYELEGSSYGNDLPYITQSYSILEINKWFDRSEFSIVRQEYWRFWDGDYWTVGKQIVPPNNVTGNDNYQLTCILIQKIS